MNSRVPQGANPDKYLQVLGLYPIMKVWFWFVKILKVLGLGLGVRFGFEVASLGVRFGFEVASLGVRFGFSAEL